MGSELFILVDLLHDLSICLFLDCKFAGLK